MQHSSDRSNQLQIIKRYFKTLLRKLFVLQYKQETVASKFNPLAADPFQLQMLWNVTKITNMKTSRQKHRETSEAAPWSFVEDLYSLYPDLNQKPFGKVKQHFIITQQFDPKFHVWSALFP